MTDAISLLKRQHQEVNALFERIKTAGAEQREPLFLQLADNIALHAQLEEKVFYPACRTVETEGTLREALEEHLSVKRILADLLDMDINDERFMPKLTVLMEQVLLHVEEEEDEFFPRVQKLLGEERLIELGAELESLEMMLKEMHAHEIIPQETQEAPPLH